MKIDKQKQKQLIIDIMDADAKDGLYAREHNSPIIQELIDETTPKELEKINKEMTKTAVEWLENELSKIGLTHEIIGDKIQQAKEMEKQQIIDAWNSAYGGDSHHEGKDFFEKTYGGNK